MDLASVPKSPDAAALRSMRRLLGKTAPPDAAIRCYLQSWRWYVRGHVVSQHAKRIIIQFMAACCGKSTRDIQADADLPECQAQHKELPQTRCL